MATIIFLAVMLICLGLIAFLPSPLIQGIVAGFALVVGIGFSIHTGYWVFAVIALLAAIIGALLAFFPILLVRIVGILIFVGVSLWAFAGLDWSINAKMEGPNAVPGEYGKYEVSNTAEIPDCRPVNLAYWEIWKVSGSTPLYYKVAETSNTPLNLDTLYFIEGERLDNPGKHTVFQFKAGTDNVDMIQFGMWECGPASISPESIESLLMKSAHDKWNNDQSQSPKIARTILVVSPLGVYAYPNGTEPGKPQNYQVTCPSTPSMQNPAAEMMADGSFVGTPGSAGCDTLFIGMKDGKNVAMRFSGVIERFGYTDGQFWLFDPSTTDQQLIDNPLFNIKSITRIK